MDEEIEDDGCVCCVFADVPSMTKREPSRPSGHGDHSAKRSQDIRRPRPKSAIIVTRSQSFNGMAQQGRTCKKMV